MKVEYKNKLFNKKEFEGRVCNFSVLNNKVVLPIFTDELTKEEILSIYINNVKKNTRIYILLPCIVFSLLFLVIDTLMLIFYDYINIRILVFCVFISLFYLFFGIYKLVKLIKKEKCYYSYTPRGPRYNFISYQKHQRILNSIRGDQI